MMDFKILSPVLMLLATVVINHSDCIAGASLYDFTVKDISGNPVNLASLRGKTILIVNTASLCEHTDSHLKSLNRLHRIMSDYNKPFEILAFPCNDFGEQEPWNLEQIETFVTVNYKCRFRLMEKVQIIGDKPHPLWEYILGSTSVTPTWNFHKYLFDSKGTFVQAWNAEVSVQSIFDDIKAVVDGKHLVHEKKLEL